MYCFQYIIILNYVNYVKIINKKAKHVKWENIKIL